VKRDGFYLQLGAPVLPSGDMLCLECQCVVYVSVSASANQKVETCNINSEKERFFGPSGTTGRKNFYLKIKEEA